MDIINQNIKLYRKDISLIKLEYVDMALLCKNLEICNSDLSSGTIYNFLTQNLLSIIKIMMLLLIAAKLQKALKLLLKSGMVLESQINNYVRMSN